MNKNQIITVAVAIAVCFILYFGFSTVPKNQKSLEKSRQQNLESTSISNLIHEALPKLDANQQGVVEALNLELEKSGEDTLAKVDRLKSLAGIWYEYQFPSISGSYAEEIAKLTQSHEAWSMAGTTYSICVKNEMDSKVKEFCSKRAVAAFETAISMEPENVEDRINLAICYVDNPKQDEPMQGILMLRELNTKFPTNVAVMNQLAKLALQTNQTEKAIARLEAAIALEPENQITICLLATAYQHQGNEAKATEFKKKCVN